MQPEPWMERANCKDQAPNLKKNPEAKDPWFPRPGESTNPGKIKCFTCDVRKECDEYRRRTHSTDGMWAGFIQKRDEDE